MPNNCIEYHSDIYLKNTQLKGRHFITYCYLHLMFGYFSLSIKIVSITSLNVVKRKILILTDIEKIKTLIIIIIYNIGTTIDYEYLSIFIINGTTYFSVLLLFFFSLIFTIHIYLY